MCETFWIMISAIATALMAIATFITIAISLQQNREFIRASLFFLLCVKMTLCILK